MFKKFISTLAGLMIGICCIAQQQAIIISTQVRLPADSVILLQSINNFFNQLSKPDSINKFASHDADFINTKLLTSELKGLADDGNVKNVYHLQLDNVVKLNTDNYLIQLDYLGLRQNLPILKASCRLIAQRKDDRYFLSSPLARNTRQWRMKTAGRFTIYSNTTQNLKLLDNYVRYAASFDKKLNAPGYPSIIYYCDNSTDLITLLGLTYNSNLTGISSDNLSAFEDNQSLYLIGAPPNDPAAFDPHDLWHSRLHHVVDPAIINRPLDEACAYLYGGSWGIKWQNILASFKTFMGTDHDWLNALKAHQKFGDVAHAPLYTDYVIDALIIKKIEKEQGFKAVVKLLTCGKKEADNAKFFTALKQVANIDQANFNATIDKLIAER